MRQHVRDEDESSGDRGDGQKGKKAKEQAPTKQKCKTCTGFVTHESGRCSKCRHSERVAAMNRQGHRVQPQHESNQQQHAVNQHQAQGGATGGSGE